MPLLASKMSARSVSVLFVVVFCVVVSVAAQDVNQINQQGVLPMVYINANSSYFGGFLQGELMGPQIRDYVSKSKNLNEKLIPWYKTDGGIQQYNGFLQANKQHYPHHVEELQGLADGSGVKFEYLFLIAISPEVNLILREPNEDACSDVLINHAGDRYLLHNEDGTDDAYNAYVLHLHYIGAEGDRRASLGMPDTISAYSYPGRFPGMSFGWNNKGMCLTNNELFPVNISLAQPTRYFMNRDMLDSSSIDDAFKRATQYGCAAGFSSNVAQTNNSRMFNVEVAPGTDANPSFTVYDVPAESYYIHFNEYLHSDQEQHPDLSSEHRLKRANELPEPVDKKSGLRILGDTKDTEYPLYREGKSAIDDYWVTLASCAIGIDSGIVEVWRSNPYTTEHVAVLLKDF